MQPQSHEVAYRKLIYAIGDLQQEKEEVYGVDWKRFGLVSVMFNIFRKFIRLRTIWQSGWKMGNDDSRLDTIIDLLNYLLLCVTFHAESFPEIFTQTFPGKSPLQFPAESRGFRKFSEEIFLPDLETHHEQTTLPVIMPKIIKDGETWVETWLSKVALAVRGEKIEIGPSEAMLRGLYNMATMCAEAALTHIQENPEEWLTFVQKYPGKG